MKNSILAIALVMNFASMFAQPCLPEGISFYFQEDIDNFQVNYPNCTQIEGDVKILGNEILNLNGLFILTEINGNLTIELVGNLISLDGLNNLTSVGGNLKIEQTSVVNISGLQNLTLVGGDFILSYNQNIENLNGLENLTSIEGMLFIRNNYSLISLNGLENLMMVNELAVLNNSSLQYINSLTSITSVPQNVGFSHNTSLRNLIGLHNLTLIGNALFIYSNSSLKNLKGLNSLKQVNWAIDITLNDSLTNLYGLDSLTTVGSVISIFKNKSLASLDGLENITSDLEYAYIHYNDSLSDLSALKNLNTSSISELSIIGNDFLSECDVESICNYLSNPTGSVEIQDNAPGCNSPEEVIEACLVNSHDNEMKNNQYIISPNPFYETTIVTFNSGDGLAFTITLSNSSGQVMNEFHFHADRTGYQQFTLETSNLGKGIYFLTINDGNEIQTSKLIKL